MVLGEVILPLAQCHALSFTADGESVSFVHVERIKRAAEGIEGKDSFVILDLDALVLGAAIGGTSGRSL